MMYFGNCKGKPVIGLDSAAQAYYGQPVAYPDRRSVYFPDRHDRHAEHPFMFWIIRKWNRDRTNRIKKLVAGEYNPQGLMDQFYGELPKDVIDNGLPAGFVFWRLN